MQTTERPLLKGRLADIFSELDGRPDVRAALDEHLFGGTPAEQLARDMTECGFPISASTVKAYRRDAKALSERKVG